MRCFFMLAVLATHVTSYYTNSFVSGSHSHALLLASHMMLHFARYGFMFITGLVMFLVYYHKPQIHLFSFWKKHFKNIGIPYVFWMGLFLIITMLLSPKPFTWNHWLLTWWKGIWHGNHFFLYYLYVTLQFYLIFPILVWIFKKTKHHHKAVLIISGLIQLAMLFYVKYVFPYVSHTGWPYLFSHYGDNVLFYQYYFILGGYIWIHYEDVKKWVRKYHNWIYLATILLSIGTVELYLFNTKFLLFKRHHATLAHQPYIMIYSTAVILAAIAFSLKYAELRTNKNWQKFSAAVSITSTLSFGIYLTQMAPIIILKRILQAINTHITSWEMLLLVPIGILFVCAGSWLISYFCYKVPPLGILIGRPNGKKLQFSKKLEFFR